MLRRALLLSFAWVVVPVALWVGAGYSLHRVYAQLPNPGTSAIVNNAIQCNKQTYKHITTATDTLLVQGVAGQTINICGVKASFSGSAAQSVFIENTASVNANCSSTLTQIGGLMTGNSSNPSVDGFYNATWGGLVNTAGNGVCVNSSGTGGVDVDIWYIQRRAA